MPVLIDLQASEQLAAAHALKHHYVWVCGRAPLEITPLFGASNLAVECDAARSAGR